MLRLLHNWDITHQFWDKSLREHEGKYTISNKYGRSRCLYYLRVEIYIIFELPRRQMIPKIYIIFELPRRQMIPKIYIIFELPRRQMIPKIYIIFELPRRQMIPKICIIFELPRCQMFPNIWRYQRGNKKPYLQNTTQILYSEPQRVKIISHSIYFISNEIYSSQYFLWKGANIFPDTYYCAIPYLNYFQLSMKVVTWYIFPE